MTNTKSSSARRQLPSMFRYALYLFFSGLVACGYQAATGTAPFLNQSGGAGGAGRTIAIPLFENATFEPILEKRVTEIFKETFFSKGWNVVSDQSPASLVLTGRIHRFERVPLSLNRSGQAEEFRVKIGMEVRFLDSESEPKPDGKAVPAKRETEGIADYFARADVAADRVAEDRAIREAGRKMAEQVADLLPTKNFFKPETGTDAPSKPASPAAE